MIKVYCLAFSIVYYVGLFILATISIVGIANCIREFTYDLKISDKRRQEAMKPKLSTKNRDGKLITRNEK